MRRLIVNADGYGLAPGICRATEECIEFGTVRSLSANVNFPAAEGLARLVERFPFVSVGCHLNPIVGQPVLSPERVPSLVGDDGCFHYREFVSRLRKGELQTVELRAELRAQITRTRALVGPALTHVDFHQGLHRLPQLYGLFLDVVTDCGVRRIRTHRYRAGLITSNRLLDHWRYVARRPARLAKYSYNVALRSWARRRGLAMPDYWVTVDDMTSHPDRITVENHVALVRNLPPGTFEFVAHPAYIDDDLRRWSSYVELREAELAVLASPVFRDCFAETGVVLSGYRDIPVG